MCKCKKMIPMLLAVLLLCCVFSTTAFAAGTGDVVRLPRLHSDRSALHLGHYWNLSLKGENYYHEKNHGIRACTDPSLRCAYRLFGKKRDFAG